MLANLVTLRAGTVGAGVTTLDVEPGLRVQGDSAVLSQVVTNLLANCDRHAPAAPVTVTARRDGATVLVEVRDEGPGLPPLDTELLFRRGCVTTAPAAPGWACTSAGGSPSTTAAA
ncbi:sensor histidine kinase [Pseudonocardia benzenivorans]